MYLSNRLTFSIFSVLLVAALVFVAAPAMAQTTVTAYTMETPETASAGNKIIITLTYSDNPDPRPAIGDFTAGDGAITQPDDGDGVRDVLTAAYNDGSNNITAAIGGSGKTVTLTFTGPNNVDISLPVTLQLKGYSTNLNGVSSDAASPTPLALADGYIGGKTYVVYVRGTSPTAASTPIPVLPSTLVGSGTGQIATDGTTTANSQLVRTIVAGSTTATENNSNMAMPDLEEFFNNGGGTIDLVVAGAGERDVVINEIMWGLDGSKTGQPGETSQQWIEVYNRKTTPAARPTFIFTNGDGNSYAPAKATNQVDRISNIAGVQNVWNNPHIKGSSGYATRPVADGTEGAINGANQPFVSVYRSNHGDGTNAGHWTASTRAYFPGFLGTPGAANTRGGFPATRPNPSAYTPPKDKIIINEVGNYTNDMHDWFELRNVSGSDVNIENWVLVRTNATQDYREYQIVIFPKQIIPAGEVLLFVNVDPIVHPQLVAGTDVTITDKDNQQRGAASHKYRKISFQIPDQAGGFLILRSSKDAKFAGGRGHLHDVVGVARVPRDTIVSGIKEPQAGNDTYWKTQAWPINGHTGNNYRVPTASGSNNTNASLQSDRNVFASSAEGTVWQRNGTAHGWRKDGVSRAVYVGGLGYQRGVMGKGTPGYHNDVVKNVVANLDGGKLVISELMLSTVDGRYPQWIELHNTSKTRGINLASDATNPKVGWRMIIENHNSGKWKTAVNDKTHVTINLKDLFEYIPPNQTVLIVSDIGGNSGTITKHHFPDHRVASIWGNSSIRAEFLMKNRRDIFLNAEGGFYIKIIDSNDKVSDEIGNLDGKAARLQRGASSIEYDDAFGWSWPTALTDRGARTSLIRLKNADKTYRAGTPIRPVEDDPMTDADETVAANESRGSVVPLGTPSNMFPIDAAWVHAVDTNLPPPPRTTYYGNYTDHGNPGHTVNTPLPVELSFFRPTLEDGKVTIQWTTESELDNAGFNILRSDTRNGEFTQVNEQMIQGKGTTAERSTYKWVDTTAKPDAVYYYQIEDISFAGEHNTLATTKLKGLISAKGKLTTSWGDIKNASQ